jgi:hypothetical protein
MADTVTLALTLPGSDAHAAKQVLARHLRRAASAYADDLANPRLQLSLSDGVRFTAGAAWCLVAAEEIEKTL